MTVITGLARLPDGAVCANATLFIARQTKRVSSQDGVVVVPQSITVTTDGAGQASFDLLWGAYDGMEASTLRRFSLWVPNVASADLADCVEAAPQDINPWLLEQAFAARAAAEAAQDTAQQLAGRYLKSYGTVTQASIDQMASEFGFVRLGEGEHLIPADIQINAPLHVAPLGYFNVQSGVTLTLRQRYTAPREWIFRGAGTVLLQHTPGVNGEDVRTKTHLAHWGVYPWAADPGFDQSPGVQKAYTAFGNTREGVILADAGNYWLKSQITTTRAVAMMGAGKRRSVWMVATDGFIPFVSGEICFYMERFNFETGGLVRTSPFIRLQHNEGRIHDVRAGSAKVSFEIDADSCQVVDTHAIFGASPGAGSSIINVRGGTGNSIKNTRIDTSVIGPTSLIDIGGNGTRTVNGTLIDGVYHRTPAATVTLAAEGGNVGSTMIHNLQNLNAQSAATDGVSIKASGTYSVTDVIVDGVTMSGLVYPALRLSNTGSGEIRTVTADTFHANGTTGEGLVLSNTGAGSISNVTLGAGFNVSQRATPITQTGSNISYRTTIHSDDVFAGWNGSATTLDTTATIDGGTLAGGLYRITSAGALGTFPPGIASTDGVLLFVQRYASGTATQIMRRALSSGGGTWFRRCISGTDQPWGADSDATSFGVAAFFGTGGASALYDGPRRIRVTLPSGAAAQIPLTANEIGGKLALTPNNITDGSGTISFRATTAGGSGARIESSQGALAISTSALTGATGTANSTNVSAQGTPALHVENRTAGTITYTLALI